MTINLYKFNKEYGKLQPLLLTKSSWKPMSLTYALY
jgi:hypothetical protein